jgi:hypothetical protein
MIKALIAILIVVIGYQDAERRIFDSSPAILGTGYFRSIGRMTDADAAWQAPWTVNPDWRLPSLKSDGWYGYVGVSMNGLALCRLFWASPNNDGEPKEKLIIERFRVCAFPFGVGDAWASAPPPGAGT